MRDLKDTISLGWHWDMDEEDIDTGPAVTRASSNCICDQCGRPYWKHRQPYKRSCPTVVVGCDGRYLKL